jgi:hypothetical protein
LKSRISIFDRFFVERDLRRKYDVPYTIGLGRQFLVRVILSWQNEFKFDLAWCPNIRLFYAKNHLYYLNRRRFRYADLRKFPLDPLACLSLIIILFSFSICTFRVAAYVNWMELTVDLIDENPALAQDLVDELVRYNQASEAKYWAGHFKVDKEKLNEPVQEAIEAAKDE